jgi:hypothetical protein
MSLLLSFVSFFGIIKIFIGDMFFAFITTVKTTSGLVMRVTTKIFFLCNCYYCLFVNICLSYTRTFKIQLFLVGLGVISIQFGLNKCASEEYKDR